MKDNIRWCQGYSESGAGSDLAGLQTRAVPDGDRFIVNGQKVWTSYADSSAWMFCLVRTKLDGAKQEGISFLLFDMEGPGVSVAPRLLISGASPFCEVFLQDVSGPEGSDRRTPPGDGWTIAKRLLQHERTMISTMGGGGTSRGTSLPDLARKHTTSPPPAPRAHSTPTTRPRLQARLQDGGRDSGRAVCEDPLGQARRVNTAARPNRGLGAVTPGPHLRTGAAYSLGGGAVHMPPERLAGGTAGWGIQTETGSRWSLGG